MTVVIRWKERVFSPSLPHSFSLRQAFFLPIESAPSLSVVSSISYCCCKRCEAMLIKMPSYLSECISEC